MKRKLSFLLTLMILSGSLFAQLKTETKQSIDSAYIIIEKSLSENPEKSQEEINKYLRASEKINYQNGVAKAYYMTGKLTLLSNFNYPKAFDYLYTAQRIFERTKDTSQIAKCNMQIGLIHYLQRNFEEAAVNFSTAENLFKSINDSNRWRRNAYLHSLCASEEKKFSVSENALNIAKQLIKGPSDSVANQEYLFAQGIYFSRRNENDSAIKYFTKILTDYTQKNETPQLYHAELAKSYFGKGDFINARKYAEKVLLPQSNKQNVQELAVILAHDILYKLDMQAGNYKTAANHLQTYITLKDSMMNERKAFELASIKSKYEISKADQENQLELKEQTVANQAQVEKQRFLKNFFILGFIFFGLLIFFLIKSNNFRRKKNAELAESLDKLKTTQEQLIRQEKLASMGKISAGIAHEIRNPLNFINNFSDISVELLQEMKEAPTEIERDELLNSVTNALKKIKEHGLRADEIVKNMLDHSRSSTLEKELCNINKLCEKNITTMLQAMLVQSPSFKCEIRNGFDEKIEMIKVVKGDIERVLINIFNNAFFAMEEKAMKANSNYKAVLTTSTFRDTNHILIRIKDNGAGIPPSILDQIFEPFFTTKPAGQGTGLGLSICNEIIKLHGGELTVNSVENEYCEFKIKLPIEV